MKRSLLLFAILIFFFLVPKAFFAQALTVSFTETPFCNWNSPADLSVNVTGGSPPYTYAWSNGATTPTITYLYQGTYCLTVTDMIGNSATACDSITNALNLTISTLPANCSSSDGEAWITFNSGTPPFNILWSTNQITDTVSNLPAGNYSVLVSDLNGCIPIGNPNYYDTTGVVNFTINRNLPYSYTITSAPLHCPMMGSAAIHVTGGTPPITYLWSTVPPQTTDSIGNLLAGTYNVIISDATPGCSVAETVNIANNLPLTVSQTSTPDVCNFNNGTATVIPQSGTLPYTYIWNTVPPQTTVTATHLNSGYYSITVLDANNCMGTRGVYVSYTSPIQPNIQFTNETCHNNNGTITLTPALGTPPYVYNWSNNATSSSLTGLNTGFYSVTVSDVQGCSVAASRYISDATSFTVNITYVGTLCSGNTGTATATVTGTTPPYTYRWNTTPPQTAQTATALALGNYQCTVTDANGCSGVWLVNIPYTNLPSAYLYPSSAYCNTSNGAINVSAFGGTTPYTYHWSNNATTQNLTNVSSGSYYVTISDAGGCTIQKGVYVPKYSNIHSGIVSTNATCIFNNDGQATVYVSNATPPLMYQWSNGQTSQTATGLASGWYYTVRVTDVNGCSAMAQSNRIGYDSLSCAAIVSGRVINDADENCAVTIGDVGIPYISVQAIPGYYDITDANGNYLFILPPGNYAVNHTPPYHTFQECPVGPIALFGLTAGSDTINNNFYDTTRTALDLSVSFNYLTSPRPGFQHSVYINYGNDGNIQTSAVIEYDYDSTLIFNSATIPYTIDLANHKIFFNLNNLPVGYHSYIRLYFTTPSGTTLGTAINECVHITPVQNDVNFVNNDECLSIEVVGSYDPNEKTVTPVGIGAEGYITRADSLLHYTIRFQNTGTNYAYNVVVLDSLDTDLDWSSISRITSSHPNALVPDYFQNKILAFYFNNIYLPDSVTNEEDSHGFVSFYIKQNPLLANGTQIKNKGAIYFDYNEPILTNEVLNTIQAPSSIGRLDNITIKVYPNPSSETLTIELNNELPSNSILSIQNIFGQTVRVQNVQLQEGKQLVILSTSEFAAGVYFVNLQNENGKYAVAKFVKE